MHLCEEKKGTEIYDHNENGISLARSQMVLGLETVGNLEQVPTALKFWTFVLSASVLCKRLGGVVDIGYGAKRP